jgi:hypothetical protein
MMTKLVHTRARSISFALVALLLTVAPTQSRTWSRNPVNLAQDYSIINDNRGNGEIVLIIWLAPPMISKGPSSQAAGEMLDKFIVLGVVHAHTSNDGTMTFDRISTLGAQDKTGQPLNALNVNTMPPTVVGALATIQSLFGRSLGPLGQGVQWFAFDSGTVHACTKGGMSVPFAGETYTYDMPIPGCS